MKKILAAAILTLGLAPAARSQSLERISRSAGASLAAAEREAFQPFQAQDIFRDFQEECGIVDAKILRVPELTEAVEALAPCFAKISDHHRIPISLRAGLFEAAGKADLTAGLVVFLPGATLEQRALAKSLEHSLRIRGGSLLGYQAWMRLSDERPSVASRLQEAVDRCILPMVLRDIESGSDFLRYYGRCVTEEPGLKVKEIRPAWGHRLAVTVVSSADARTVAALNGTVSVPGRAGQVQVLVMAYPETVYLP